ncbi:MAG: hypothetical protein U9N51_11755 [Bacteroidota bacterium]|nr:hypothetical protein [Bacteroidota bacterium]
MSTKEKNNLAETNDSEQIKNQSKFKRKLIAFFKNNKAATFLGILLIIVVAWFFIKLQINEAAFKKEKIQIKEEKNQLIEAYEGKIDSLKVDHVKFATEVFSWSVRSEMLRENTENLNQLLTIFVKQSDANIVQLVNPKDNIILLSSDKKYEGSQANNNDYDNLTSTIVLNKDNTTKIISPVMGFNEKIGVLIVELKQEKEKIKENNTNPKED